MKKFRGIVLGLAVAALGSLAFAEHEMALNYTLGGYFEKMRDGDFKDQTLNYKFSPFGLAATNQWIKANEEKAVNVGFDLKVGMWLSIGQKWKANGVTTNDKNWVNIGEYVAIGPVFRCRINEKNAFYITPGIQLNFEQDFYIGSGVTNCKAIGVEFAPSLDLAYRHWFTDRVGLNLGFDMDIPLIGYYGKSYNYWNGKYTDTVTQGSTTGVGFEYHFLVGIVLR